MNINILDSESQVILLVIKLTVLIRAANHATMKLKKTEEETFAICFMVLVLLITIK